MANEFTNICAPSLGALFGRIQPAGWTAPDGSWVLALGADKAGHVIDTWPAVRIGINGVFPTGFAGGETIQIAVDHGSTQVITFLAADQLLDQVVDRINAALTDAAAANISGELGISTTSRGLNAHIDIVGGTALTALGHLATTGVGHGGIQIGDYFGFIQQIDLTLPKILTFKMKMAQPTNVDFAFQMIVDAGGATLLTIEPAQGTTVDFVTRHVNVAALTGNVNVSLLIQAVPA